MALAFPTPSLPPWPLGRVISFLKLKIHFVLCIIDGMSLWRPGRRQGAGWKDVFQGTEDTAELTIVGSGGWVGRVEAGAHLPQG